MKKLMIVGAMVATMAFAFTGCGSDKKVYSSRTYSSSSGGVPERVLDEFYDMYPAAQNANWKVNDGLYQVDFELGNDDMKATFTPNGDLVRVDS